MKIAVAMSGGVDSSVAAALMVEEYGKENVFGVTMRLFCYGSGFPSTGAQDLREKSCCSVEAVNDAKSICNQLGIPHYALSLEKEFEEAVVQNFISEYEKGHTPIPCVLCNTVIKFETLLKKVQELGADRLATGHYARVEEVERSKYKVASGKSFLHSTCYMLLRGVDEQKDQSYFLYGLNQEQLSSTIFPLGEMEKTAVRKLAAKFKLKTAGKKESQGICFVTEGRVTDWLRDKIEIKHGNIVDTKGSMVGEHEGIIFYTIGQRKRIGGGYTEPMYVVRIDAENNEVVIGTKNDLYSSELIYISSNWVSGVGPKMPLKCTAKIRYNMDDAECIVCKKKEKSNKKKVANDERPMTNDEFYEVKFKEPQRAVTPGQSIVLYDGDVVLGGGIIVG